MSTSPSFPKLVRPALVYHLEQLRELDPFQSQAKTELSMVYGAIGNYDQNLSVHSWLFRKDGSSIQSRVTCYRCLLGLLDLDIAYFVHLYPGRARPDDPFDSVPLRLRAFRDFWSEFWRKSGARMDPPPNYEAIRARYEH